jgi:hypothetical protein
MRDGVKLNLSTDRAHSISDDLRSSDITFKIQHDAADFIVALAEDRDSALARIEKLREALRLAEPSVTENVINNCVCDYCQTKRKARLAIVDVFSDEDEFRATVQVTGEVPKMSP